MSEGTIGKALVIGHISTEMRRTPAPLMLPAPASHHDDIPPLVRRCTRRLARRTGGWIETIPSAVMEAQVRYPGPGNIRELHNVIQAAVVLSPAHHFSSRWATCSLRPLGIPDVRSAPVASGSPTAHRARSHHHR